MFHLLSYYSEYYWELYLDNVPNKRFPVNGRRAILFQRVQMCLRPIPFVAGKSICGIHLVIFYHQAIPCHFRNNAAAAMEALFASPLIIGICRMDILGIVTASLRSKSGVTANFPMAWRMASYVA